VGAWVEVLSRRAAPLLAAHGQAVPDVSLVTPEAFERWRADAIARDPGRAALLAPIEGLRPHLTLAPRWFDDTLTRQALDAAGVPKRVPFDFEAIDAYAIRSHWGLRPEPRPPLGPPPRFAATCRPTAVSRA